MSSGKVGFRGINGKLYLEVESEDLDSALLEFKDLYEKNRQFYKGADLVGIESESLSLREKIELGFILKHLYKFNISDTTIDGLLNNWKMEDEKIKAETIDAGVMTKFINKTIRSGQEINYDGNIVVVGDVNSGAILKATGSIVVLGNFRGVAHAGLDGDETAIVASYKLMPLQLRIADKIARSPDEELNSLKSPEIARIIKDRLVIEPYLPNK